MITVLRTIVLFTTLMVEDLVRIGKLIWCYLFMWSIRPHIFSWGEYAAFSSNKTPRGYRTPGWWKFRQFWYWEHPDHYCRGWTRIQLVRTYVDKGWQ